MFDNVFKAVVEKSKRSAFPLYLVMSEKIYLQLLLFCGILCQAIFATLSDNDTRSSSDFLVRKRRVINHLPSGQAYLGIVEVKYIVAIKEDAHPFCAGVILSHRHVLTAALCFRYDVSRYTLLSGATSDLRAKKHTITSKLTYSGNPPHKQLEEIALITVEPPFMYSGKTGNIRLHAGPLATGTEVTVFGWGHRYPLRPGPERRHKLRFINLPIMNHQECTTIYQGRIEITDKHICTDCEHQYCAMNDEGAPLVFNETLAAIFVRKGSLPNHRNPDVYINVQRPDYSEWIREHVILQ